MGKEQRTQGGVDKLPFEISQQGSVSKMLRTFQLLLYLGRISSSTSTIATYSVVALKEQSFCAREWAIRYTLSLGLYFSLAGSKGQGTTSTMP